MHLFHSSQRINLIALMLISLVCLISTPAVSQFQLSNCGTFACTSTQPASEGNYFNNRDICQASPGIKHFDHSGVYIRTEGLNSPAPGGDWVSQSGGCFNVPNLTPTARLHSHFWKIPTLCTEGFRKVGSSAEQAHQCMASPILEKDNSRGDATTCYPIDCATGQKIISETDYQSYGPDPIEFTRRYVSPIRKKIHDQRPDMPWRPRNIPSLKIINANTSGSQLMAVFRIGDSVQRILTKPASGTTWSPESSQYAPISYDEATRTITYNGRQYDFSNNTVGVTGVDDGFKLLTLSLDQLIARIENNHNQYLDFTRDANNRLTSIVDQDGYTVKYEYDTLDNLIKVIYPDDTPNVGTDNPTKQYLYENINYPNNLTGIIDERGIRTATYTYNTDGFAASSIHGNGANREEVTYDSDTQATVKYYQNATDYREEQLTYALKGGHYRLTQKVTTCNTCTSSSTKTWSYDAVGRLSSIDDANGNTDVYQYHGSGQLKNVYRAYGTSQQLNYDFYQYNAFNQPQILQTFYQTITRSFDGDGSLLSNAVKSNRVNYQTATTNYTYTSNKLLSTIDGPRTDVTDVMTFEYNTDGNRTKITNALNHITQITSYDGQGKPLTMIDPNGVTTQLNYNARQWLISSTVAYGTAEAATTLYTYDAAGNLTRITLPNNTYLDYQYDDANRITDIQDNVGNRIHYTLDVMGNQLQQDITDPSSVLKHTQSATFNHLRSIVNVIGANNQTTQYAYDDNKNRTQITDANSHVSTHNFDALDRIIKTIDPENGAANATQYKYDKRGNLKEVTDPKGLKTHYFYDGFDRLTKMISPDTGTTDYQYDLAGNRTQQSDARGVTVDLSYDAINRLTQIDYPGTSDDISYTYDDTTNNNVGIGRLTTVADPSGATVYRYDVKGNIINVTAAININNTQQSTSVQYQYDAANNITQVTYPSGRTIHYTRNALGQITHISTDYNSQTQTLASNINYLPFGPQTSLTYGNNLIESNSYNQDYQLTQRLTVDNTTIQNLSYTYDANGNINIINNTVLPALNQDFNYDAIDRLTDANGDYGDIDYSYDPVGNRNSKTIDTQVDNYAYASNKHHLLNINTNQTIYTYDAVGNTLSDGTYTYTYTYNHRNRLQSVTQNSITIAEYQYNAQGQRTIKTMPSKTTLYTYNQNGQLIAETDELGNLEKEYVYFNQQPLALIDYTQSNDPIYYYHNDHLGTPQALTDATQQIVWTAKYSPFGYANIMTSLIEQNIRSPGQYFDQETNLHYNHFRYYNSQTGRYITSDPIGLDGGINTYGYAFQNPIRYTDPDGLNPIANIMNFREGGSTLPTDAPISIKRQEKAHRVGTEARKVGKAMQDCLICFVRKEVEGYIPGKVVDKLIEKTVGEATAKAISKVMGPISIAQSIAQCINETTQERK